MLLTGYYCHFTKRVTRDLGPLSPRKTSNHFQFEQNGAVTDLAKTQARTIMAEHREGHTVWQRAFPERSVELEGEWVGGIMKLSNNQPPMVTLAEIPNKMKYEFETAFNRFMKEHNITKFKMNEHFLFIL